MTKKVNIVNRSYLTFGYGITDKIHVEFGIMEQVFSNRPDRPQFQVTLSESLPFVAKKKNAPTTP